MDLTPPAAAGYDGSVLPLVPVVVVFMLALGAVAVYFSGWWLLARVYGARGPFAGRRWKWQWGTMNGVALNKAVSLAVGADARGLRLDVTCMLVPVAPPIFVPWSEVTPVYRHVGWIVGDVVELSFAQVPGVRLRIREGLAESIAAEAGSAFGIEGGPSGPRLRAQPSSVAPGTAPAAAPAPPGRMRCPRCGFEQPRAAECAGCGIVLAKYHGAAGPKKSPDRVVREEYQERLQELTPQVWVTPALIGVNAAVFVAMLFGGVGALAPDVQGLIGWGANYGPRTAAQEPWRLFTCMFVHVGIVHLAFNMLVLSSIGRLVERLIGNVGFFVVYLLSGLYGSLASVFWNPVIVSAGASGAIFGLYGALLGFLSRGRGEIPAEVLKPQRKGALLFLGYNLLYGLSQPGIDMAAHLGGLAAGFVCGLALAAPLTDEGVTGRWPRNLLLAGAGLVALAPASSALPHAPDVYAELAVLAPIQARLIREVETGMKRWKAGQVGDEDLAEMIERRVLPEWHVHRVRLEAMNAALPSRQQGRLARVLAETAEREEDWRKVASAMREGQGEKAVSEIEAADQIRRMFRRRRQGDP